jgi:hypothetical protein
MKRATLVTALLAVSILTSCQTTKSPATPAMPTYTGSAEFERMKSLVGQWHGESPMGPMNVTYKLTAAGSMIEERVFEGSPMEMLSAYYDEGGKLAMTHYCALHNRPKMKLVKSTPDSISFNFVPSPGIDPTKDHHMHSQKIIFIDANHIKMEGGSWANGKPEQSCPPMELTRK